MSAVDYVIAFVYLLLLSAFVGSRKVKFITDRHEEKFFMRAFYFKIIGVTFFAFIYLYYYRGGDTLAYYSCCDRFVKLSQIDFEAALKYLFTDNVYAYQRFMSMEYSDCNWIGKYNSRELVFIKFSTILNFLALNSYLALSYIYATASFFASWRLYEVFKYSFPNIKKQLLYASLFVPTVAFWGTGLMKDTLTYIALCYLIYFVFKGVILKIKIFQSIALLLFFAYVLAVIKAYILLVFIPAGITWIFLHYNYLIKSSFLRFLIAPFFIVMSIVTIYFIIQTIEDSLDQFSLDQIQKTAEGFQSWHTSESKNGAGYRLYFDGFSASSMLKVFPQAVNVTYFRPYLWEAKNFISLISAVESLSFLIIFIYSIFIKAKFFGALKMLTSHPLIIMCLIFTLLLGFAVGLTSYNFGALSRYKIPAMPLFAIMLVLLSNYSKNDKANS
jgi:hypothetical protein